MGQTTNNPLPETYYLDYFNFLLTFTQKNYANIIGKYEISFIKKFQKLSFEAQCLFVRLANRKGPLFRTSKVIYREIPNVDLSITELNRNGFVSFDNKTGIEELLFLFTKNELLNIGKRYDWSDIYKNSDKKEDIIFSIIDRFNENQLEKILFDEDVIIFFECTDLIAFFKLLFFGNLYSDMTQFVIRDIGNIKLEDFTGVEFTPNFSSRHEIEEYLFIANVNQEFKVAKEALSPINVYRWFSDLQIRIENTHHKKINKLFLKLILRLGKLLETEELLDEALIVYQNVKISPARERQIRLLKKLGRLDQANELAKTVLDSPDDAKEELFAKDFLNATNGRIKRSTTLTLKTADQIFIVQNQNLKVEEQAISYYQSLGFEAFHTENTLWRFLFGLLFWDEMYDPSLNSFHHPLQRSPSDLLEPSFYEKRNGKLEKKIQSIRSRKKLCSQIKNTFEIKRGIANHLVYWDDQLLDLSLKSIELLPLAGLKKTLLMIAKQVKSNSTGFPDLFVFKGNQYFFCEIKSPNDHLSAQQLFWIEFLNECKIKAKVIKVKWELANSNN